VLQEVTHIDYIWPGLGKSTMYVQELKSLLLINFIATFMHYPDTTIEWPGLLFQMAFSWPCRALKTLWQFLVGFNKVALLWGCSHSSMTVIRRPALPCSVVLWPLMALLALSWFHCVWRVTLAHRPLHPPTQPSPYMRHLWYFVPHLKKTLKNQQIQKAGIYINIY